MFRKNTGERQLVEKLVASSLIIYASNVYLACEFRSHFMLIVSLFDQVKKKWEEIPSSVHIFHWSLEGKRMSYYHFFISRFSIELFSFVSFRDVCGITIRFARQSRKVVSFERISRCKSSSKRKKRRRRKKRRKVV